MFFDGKKPQVLRSLEREMHAHAKRQEFEDAERCKRQLFALRHIEDVSLIRREPRMSEGLSTAVRVEGYDVAHLSGKAMVGVMTVVEGGEAQKREYRTFNIRSVSASNDTAALTELLKRRLAHPEWPYPRLIVVDGGIAQENAARRVLETAGVEIPVVAVTKDERHRPKVIRGPLRYRRDFATDILLANAEAHRFSLARHRRKVRTAHAK
jgi:excinuclease ABC subunit C